MVHACCEGYGLSYTSWEYSDMKVGPALVKPCENVTVTVTLHNTGNRAGSEVVQLCVQLQSISFARPLAFFISYDC